MLSIRDLLGLAEIAQKKAVYMPDTIDFQFREAIAARAHLTEYFRNTCRWSEAEEQVTCNHEYFTQSLAEIYTNLCKWCHRPESQCQQCKRDSLPKSSAVGNRFETLSLSMTASEVATEHERPHNDGERLTKRLKRNRTPCKHPVAKADEKYPKLINDTLGEAFELRKQIQDAFELLAVTIETWKMAARSEISIVVAAFTANTVYTAFEGIEQQLAGVLCHTPEPAVILDRFKQLEPATSSPLNCKDVSGSSLLAFNERLCQASDQLCKMKAENRGKQEAAVAHADQPTSEVTLVDRAMPMMVEEGVLRTMLESIVHHIRCTCQCASIVRTSTPVLAEVGYFLTQEQLSANSLRCSYGLQLLLEAHEAYQRNPEAISKPANCRLTALRFAQEAMLTVRAVLNDSTMPCRCGGTLAYHLENLHGELSAYLQTKGFDIYLQSPWAAGAHMLEMLEALFYYGLRLFSYRCYAGAVLHAYNVLTSLEDIEPIPLLENICRNFGDILFPGGRPCKNFKNCYVRYMGGRLRFHGQKSNHRSGCHSMAIPAHAAKAAAGFGARRQVKDPRFDCQKVSFFHSLQAKSYQLDDKDWNHAIHLNSGQDQLDASRKGQWRSCCHHTQWEEKECQHKIRHRFSKLQEAVGSEFGGDFPIARIDLFKVYLAFVRTVDMISDGTHDDGDDTRRGQKCLCFADIIATAGDRCIDCRGNGLRMRSYLSENLSETCQAAMLKEFAGRKSEDFLWENV